MSLVSNPNRPAIVPHRHPRRCLLRADGTRLVLVLDERNPLAARHQPHLAEAFEAAEDGGKGIRVDVVGQVSQEQDLVRREVFVGDDGGSGRSGGLESSAPGCFRWTTGVGRSRANTGGSLQLLLRLERFLGLLSFCRERKKKKGRVSDRSQTRTHSLYDKQNRRMSTYR